MAWLKKHSGLFVRLRGDLLDQVDAVAQRATRTRTDGKRVSRAEAVRTLIAEALEARKKRSKKK